MNKQIKQKRINECLRLVDTSYKLIKNYVKPHPQNSDEHEIAKFIKCLQLMREGKEIYTEVKFKTGKGRCDILVPEDFQVFEILYSETTEEALIKTKKYPKQLEIFLISSKEILEENKAFI